MLAHIQKTRCFVLTAFALLLGRLQHVDGQCNGSVLQISSGSGLIQSPNYPFEYEKKANCLWNFSRPTDGEEYSLKLKITTMRLFFLNGTTERYCPESYNLTIDGETLDCFRLVAEASGHFCHAFNSAKCTNLELPCETTRIFSSPISVSYQSDGQKTIENQTIWGFRIEYSFTECEVFPETTQPESIETTSTAVQTLTPIASVRPNISSSLHPTTRSASSLHPTTRSGTTFTSATFAEITPSYSTGTATTTHSTPTTPTNVIAIVLGVIGGIIVLLLAAAVAFYIWKRRKNGLKAEESVTYNQNEDTPEGEYENETLPRKPRKAMMPPNVHDHTYINDSANLSVTVPPRQPQFDYEKSAYDG